MYKATQTFEIAGYPLFEEGETYSFPEDKINELVSRGLIVLLQPKKAEKKEVKKDESKK